MVYITADYHLNHFNIIKHCNRPFQDLEQMNRTIINNHNACVKPEDTVFFLGDFCFGRIWDYLNQFNGKFIFVEGNHDKRTSKLPYHMKAVILYRNGKQIYLTHSPNNLPYGYDLYFAGHIHNKWKFKEMKAIGNENNNYVDVCNVGVDVWEFFPITLEKLFEEYYRWKNIGGTLLILSNYI